MNQYVLCYAHPKAFQFWPEVLLIKKNKPAWQAGLFNLPGGSVEDGETPHEAALRELREETGIEADQVTLLGTVEGPGWVVYVTRCEYDSLRGRNVVEKTTDEDVFWMPLAEALRHPKLIGNLRYIIPFCRSNLVGWSMSLMGVDQNGPIQVLRKELYPTHYSPDLYPKTNANT